MLGFSRRGRLSGAFRPIACLASHHLNLGAERRARWRSTRACVANLPSVCLYTMLQSRPKRTLMSVHHVAVKETSVSIHLHTVHAHKGRDLEKKMECGVTEQVASPRPTKQASPDVFFAKSVGFGTNIIGTHPALAQTYTHVAQCICAKADRFWTDF